MNYPQTYEDNPNNDLIVATLSRRLKQKAKLSTHIPLVGYF
jgi:hypothetical protein